MLDPGVVMVMMCGVPFVLVLVVHHLIVRNGLVKLKKRKKEKKNHLGPNDCIYYRLALFVLWDVVGGVEVGWSRLDAS